MKETTTPFFSALTIFMYIYQDWINKNHIYNQSHVFSSDHKVSLMYTTNITQINKCWLFYTILNTFEVNHWPGLY